jgi:hypothetical protein
VAAAKSNGVPLYDALVQRFFSTEARSVASIFALVLLIGVPLGLAFPPTDDGTYPQPWRSTVRAVAGCGGARRPTPRPPLSLARAHSPPRSPASSAGSTLRRGRYPSTRKSSSTPGGAASSGCRLSACARGARATAGG